MNNYRTLFAIGLVILLSACTEPAAEPDQCVRREIFAQCLSSVPPGPQSTHYNAWDDVVSACEQAAYYQSLRAKGSIKEGCSTKPQPGASQ